MAYPNLTHHGGATGVTGSCHRLHLAADRALLVDCGLFQGQDAESADNLEQHRVTFPIDDVLALIVTHVHIDHIGRLPYLLAAGYRGPILCSVPSARLLPLVIEDALKVGFTRDRKLIERFLEEVHSRLVLESTYGDRLHEDRSTRQARLKAAIDHALENNGTVVIPAFSIGRTQELLYELEDLIHQATDPHWQDLEIIIDSPLAARFTEAYRDLKPYWDLEARERLHHGRHPLAFENLYTVDSHEEHLQTVDYLARTGRPAVVIAASGMAAGGRVVNYLKRMLGDVGFDRRFP